MSVMQCVNSADNVYGKLRVMDTIQSAFENYWMSIVVTLDESEWEWTSRVR